MFRNCKWVVTIEKLELGSFGGEGENMKFDSSSSKKAPKHKRFERVKNKLKWYRECAVSYSFNSLWEHTFWK
jgi:hypothetical protein